MMNDSDSYAFYSGTSIAAGNTDSQLSIPVTTNQTGASLGGRRFDRSVWIESADVVCNIYPASNIP